MKPESFKLLVKAIFEAGKEYSGETVQSLVCNLIDIFEEDNRRIKGPYDDILSKRIPLDILLPGELPLRDVDKTPF